MFEKIDSKLLFTKNDIQDPRLGEFVSSKNNNANCVVVGYCDDEGISNNGGRVGARYAPNMIREYLYKMTPPMSCPQKISIYDLGNLVGPNTLEERHLVAQKNVREHILTHKILSLGGGHDYGYPDGAGFLDTYKDQRPLIINFDAHLDVRPFVQKKITSGTPFRRLLESYPKAFDFLEIGVQSQCNSHEHFQWALSQGTHVLSYDEIALSGGAAIIKMLDFFEPFLLKRRPVYLSVDMDVFSSAFAPGCSQVFPTGLTPMDFMPLLKVLLKRLDIRILGIYETSPSLDVGDRTSRLASQIAYDFLFFS